MANESTSQYESSRRDIIKGSGVAVGGLALTGVPFTTTARAESATASHEYVLRQGDRCVPVIPFEGDQSAAAFYDYRLPEQFVSDTNGGRVSETDSGYASFGTTRLQRDGESLLFLYDGSDGLNLVLIHGDVHNGESGGGSVTMQFSGLTERGSWVVKDDYYVDPDSSEIAKENYDNWQTNGSSHVIDWTWGNGRTDGGVFNGLGDKFSITIDPAFNEAATLHGKHYEGEITSWKLLVPDRNHINRIDLDISKPVTIENGRCPEKDSFELPGLVAIKSWFSELLQWII